MLIRVFMIGRQPLLQQKIKTILSVVSGFKVIGEASDGTDAIQKLRQFEVTWLLPDILLAVTTAPEQEINLAIQYSRQHFQSLKVIVLTDLTDHSFLMNLLHLNVQGCLSDQIKMPDLIRAIRSVHHGYSRLDDVITRQVLPRLWEGAAPDSSSENPSHHNDQDISSAGQAASRLSQLSPREQEVLQLIATGASNQEIAQRLFIAKKTVKNHITQIFKKLAIHNRTQAAIVARKQTSQQEPF
ncbi:MAG: response regulator transcription factor [Cyanobacteria bacterium P01_D01_bin.44]